jgi:tetratricopeptide (TPR) repeat protein
MKVRPGEERTMSQSKDKLVGVYSKILALDPKSEEANSGMAAVLIDEGRFQDALPYLEAALAAGTKDRRLKILAAGHYARSGNLQRARNLLDEGPLPEKGEERTALFDALSILSADALRRGDCHGAFSLARRARGIPGQKPEELDGTIAESASRFVQECLARKDVKRAHECIADAVELLPGDKRLAEKKAQCELILRSTSRRKLIIYSGVSVGAIVVICAAAALVAFLTKNKDGEEAGMPSASSPVDGEPGSGGDAPGLTSAGPAGEPQVSPSAVEEFIKSAWAKFQQTGDSKAYEAILADEFTAVSMLRAGKTTEYSKADWLKRRENALSTGIELTVGDFTVTKSTPQDVETEFSYVWNSDDYCDRGKKRLLLKPADNTWLVVREETLSSEECDFASYSTFRTFVGAFAMALRKKDWPYVNDHTRYPFLSKDPTGTTSFPDIIAVKHFPWLGEFKWARVEKKEVMKTADNNNYSYVSSYGGQDRGSVTVKVYDFVTGEQHSARYGFVFLQDRWYWEERYAMAD